MFNKFLKVNIFILTCLFLVSCNFTSPDNNTRNITETSETPKQTSTLVFAGDVLVHDAQLEAAYDPSTKDYNFNSFFDEVKDYISDADLAICNSETSYLGEGSTYAGYPCFNTPDSLLDSLKYAGFDVLSSAHNHIIDNGLKGVSSTAKAISTAGFDLLGIKNNATDKNYLVKDVNGIKVGLTNYTYAEKTSSGITINSIPMPDNLKNIINYFAINDIDSYIETMKNTITNMKNDGAEFIIFYIHWGDEYKTTPNEGQEYLAKKLNELGVDVIIGSHPHVVQSIRTVKNFSDSKETLVCYSLGNFVSNQRLDTMGNIKSEDGLMVKLNLIKTDDGSVILDSYDAIPTWVDKYKDQFGKVQYRILNTKDILDNKDDYSQYKDVFNNIENSYNSTEEIIRS